MPTPLAIALVVAAWAVLPFPLAVLVGRALGNGAAVPAADGLALGAAAEVAVETAVGARAARI